MCICEACPVEGFSSGIHSHCCFLKGFSSYLIDWLLCPDGFSSLLFIPPSSIKLSDSSAFFVCFCSYSTVAAADNFCCFTEDVIAPVAQHCHQSAVNLAQVVWSFFVIPFVISLRPVTNLVSLPKDHGSFK